MKQPHPSSLATGRGPARLDPRTLTGRTQITVTDTSCLLALDLYGALAQTVVALGLTENIVDRTASSTQPQLGGKP